MVCTSPLKGVRLPNGELLFGKTLSATRGNGRDFVFSCGCCQGCLLRRARDTAIRCVHESTLHPSDSCHFLTFTYSDHHIPRLPICGRPTLDKTAMPSMFKRLRANTGQKGIKYLQVGEYGTKTLRPHYHAVVFGLRLDDRRVFSRGRFGHSLFNSTILQDAWLDQGHVVAAEFNFDTAQYCSRYLLDKQLHEEYTGAVIVDADTGECSSPQVEDTSQSRGGRTGHGLAYDFWQIHKRELVALGGTVIKDKVLPLPRYYRDLLNKSDDRESQELLFDLDLKNQLKYGSREPMDDRALLLKRMAEQANIQAMVRDVVSRASL